jgi:hypothetical protein
MTYLLSPSFAPDLQVQIDARYAESFRTAGNIAQRFMEIAYRSGATLGVVVNGKERVFGSMAFPGKLEGPLVKDVASLEKLGQGMSLKEQQSVLKELKRIFGGPMRQAMTAVSAAFGNRAVYFVFRDMGPMLIVPAEDGNFRLAVIRMDGARTMDEERMCAAINRTSLNAYSFLWRALSELQKKQDAEEKAARAAELDRVSPPMSDMLDNPEEAAAQRHSRHDDEEDELDDDVDDDANGGADDEAPFEPVDSAIDTTDDDLNVPF